MARASAPPEVQIYLESKVDPLFVPLLQKRKFSLSRNDALLGSHQFYSSTHTRITVCDKPTVVNEQPDNVIQYCVDFLQTAAAAPGAGYAMPEPAAAAAEEAAPAAE